MMNKFYYLYFCVDRSVRIIFERLYSLLKVYFYIVIFRKFVFIFIRFELFQFDVSSIFVDVYNERFLGDYDEIV